MFGGDCYKTICVILAILVIALFVIFTIGFYKAWKETLTTNNAKGLYITALVASIVAGVILVWWFVKYCWGCDWGCDWGCEDPCDKRVKSCAPNRMGSANGMGMGMGNARSRSPLM